MSDLHSVISDAISDASLAPETQEDDQVLETSPEASSDPVEPILETPEPDDSQSLQVSSPVSKTEPAKAQDDFEKQYGVAAQVGGRENRIPYPRVKNIVKNAEKNLTDRLAKQYETSHVPVERYKELETKVADYDARWQEVAEFERVMMTDTDKFIGMLSQLPQYAKIFEKLTQPEAQAPVQEVADDMPLPDYDMADGSKVYSMDGLKKLQEWNVKQAEDRAYARITKEYGPIRKSFDDYQKVQSVLPQVKNQIAAARKWDLFDESEAEITQALAKNPTWSLAEAYNFVVIPKLKSKATKAEESAKVDRDKVRAEVLAELKKAPKATSASSGSTRPSSQSESSGPRSLEDVIKAQIETIR
jgi:hypothetical protein